MLGNNIKIDTLITVASLLAAVITAVISLTSLKAQVENNKNSAEATIKELYETKNSIHELRFVIEKLTAKQEQLINDVNHLKYRGDMR